MITMVLWHWQKQQMKTTGNENFSWNMFNLSKRQSLYRSFMSDLALCMNEIIQEVRVIVNCKIHYSLFSYSVKTKIISMVSVSLSRRNRTIAFLF